VFSVVAAQIARLFDAAIGSVVRFDATAGVGQIVGGWSADGAQITGQTIDLAGTSAAALVYQSGAPVQTQSDEGVAGDLSAAGAGPGGALCAPVLVEGRLWGSAGVVFAAGTGIPASAAERLARFGELVAVAIANAHARETLVQEATTDPVTGLANHRAFHERLRAELERASRHGHELSLTLFDLDHFKRINDTHGHQIGDEVLAAVARRLAAVARNGELVARTGGEEFAWLMPETSQDHAFLAADRARRAIEATPFPTAGALTISAGVCSSQYAPTGHELFNAADRALYCAKRVGRNTTFRYTPDIAAPAEDAR
jgi:diguanylate cyclase (GGDEF)-like protein